MVAGVILFLAKCFECCGEGLWKKVNGGYLGRRFRVDYKCSEFRSAFRIPCLVWICRHNLSLNICSKMNWNMWTLCMTFAYIMCNRFVHTLCLLNQLIWQRCKVHWFLWWMFEPCCFQSDVLVNGLSVQIIIEQGQPFYGTYIEEYPFSIQRCSFSGVGMCRRDTLAVLCWLSSQIGSSAVK